MAIKETCNKNGSTNKAE